MNFSARLAFSLMSLPLLAASGCNDRPMRRPEVDAASIAVDGGSVAAADGGAAGDAGVACTDLRPTSMSLACSASTRDCWSACTTQGCVDSCIASDPSPACASCFAQNESACIVDFGCLSEWTGLACCRESACPSAPFVIGACPGTDGPCASTADAVRVCATKLGHAGCGAQVSACFPPRPM